MKDQAVLLISAIGFAVVAWAFWHYLGESAFGILTLLALLIFAFDNVRLRRRMKERTRD